MKKIFLPILILALSVFSLQAQTWVQQTSPVSTDLNSAWAVSDQICWMCGPAGLVVRTTNAGTTWALANTGLSGNDFYTITAVDANICIVGAGDGGLWRTTNGGTSWTFITLTPPAVFMDVVHMFNATEGFAMSDPVGGSWKYYITTNAGANWTAGPVTIPSVGSEAGWNNAYDALDTGRIWWGTNVTKIWRGSFRGPWTSAATAGRLNSFGVAFNNASTGVACFQTLSNMGSVDGGLTWTVGSYTPPATAFALKSVKGTGYMWIGWTLGIARSTNSGTSFTTQQALTQACYGLTFASVNRGWACTALGQIWRYTDFVGIDPNNTNVPQSYSLQQNYPNPFNPTTTIKYSIPNASFVTLNIYDALGNLIKTVVSGNQAAGNYVEDVDMSSFASGIYFYSLRAGSFTETKKMTLVK